MPRILVAGLIAPIAALALALPTGVQASSPGANGRIAFGSLTPAKSSKRAPNSVLKSVFGDGTAATKVAAKKKYVVSSPEYSADGTKIAFLLGAYGKHGKADGLYVAAFDGSGARRVAKPSWADGIAWSPDGQTLVYADVMDGLYVVAAGGGKPKLIVPVAGDGGFFRRPTFTPDGNTLLFERDTYSTNADGKAPWLEVVELWKASAGSGNVAAAAPLFPKASMPFAGEPDVSPDGKTVAFVGPLDKYGKRYGLYTAPLDGSTPPKRLLKTRKGTWLDGASWAPDGTRIAFAMGASKKGSSVRLIDPATASMTTLVRSTKSELSAPTWQPLNPSPAQ